MGNTSRKTGQLPDEVSGLTDNQKNLIRSTWRTFCNNNREYGVLLFLSLFVKHPQYLPMFRNFRSKHVATLKDDPAFRAHGCAVGYHLTSMVENLADPATFEVLVRRNATDHLRRKGVRPHHFEVMGQCVVDVLQAKEERMMTPEAVEAWTKFLSYMVAIIKDVFDKAAAERGSKYADSSSERSATSVMDEAALTASLGGTEMSTAPTSPRGGARKSEPKAASPHKAEAPGKAAGSRSAPEDMKSRKEPSTAAPPREGGTTSSSPQGDKSGAAEKAASSPRDKGLPRKSAMKKGAPAEEKGALSPKDQPQK